MKNLPPHRKAMINTFTALINGDKKTVTKELNKAKKLTDKFYLKSEK